MASAAIHFVRVGLEVRGPLREEQLREMATIDVVTAESEVATNRAGPWVRLATLPLWAKVKPVSPAFAFKGNEFRPVNIDEAPAMDPRDVLVRPGLVGSRGEEPLNEVQRMVLEVGQRVVASAPPEILPPPPPRFPMLRWLAMLSVIGTGAILALPWFYGRTYDSMSATILGGWVVLFNAALVAILALERRQKEQFRFRRVQLEKLE